MCGIEAIRVSGEGQRSVRNKKCDTIPFPWLASVLFAVLVVSGCSRAPSFDAHVRRENGFVTRYCGTNLHESESALLQWEQFALSCERKGTPGINFDVVFRGIHECLYLVETALGRTNDAERHFGQAVWYAHERETRDGFPLLSTEELRALISKRKDYGLDVKWKQRR